MRRPVSLVAALVLLAVALAGCNDDAGSTVTDSAAADDGGTTDGGAATVTGGDATDDGGATTDDGTDEPTDDGAETTGDGGEPTDGDDDGEATDDPRTEEEIAADEAAAAAALLTLEDLGAGWEEEARDEDIEAQEDFNEELAGCLGVDQALLDKDDPNAQSNDFVNAEQQIVNNEVTYAATEEDAATALEIIQLPQTPDCFGAAVDQLIQANLDELQAESGDVEIGTPTVERTDVPDLADGSAGLLITLPITTAQGQEVDLYIGSYAVQVGRARIALETQSAGTPFDAGEVQRLLELVIDRVGAA